jgi:hypothetical protein
MNSFRQVQYFAACVIAIGILALSLPDPSVACGAPCLTPSYCYGTAGQNLCQQPGASDLCYSLCGSYQNQGCCFNGTYNCGSSFTCGSGSVQVTCHCDRSCF